MIEACAPLVYIVQAFLEALLGEVLRLTCLESLIEGAGLEAVIVGGACTFFLAMRWTQAKREKEAKWKSKCVPGESSNQRLSKPVRSMKAVHKPPSNAVPSKRPDEELDNGRAPPPASNNNTRRDNNARSFRQAMTCLERYAMVCHQGVNLHERTTVSQAYFYLNLIGCIIQVGEQKLPKLPGVDGTADWIRQICKDIRESGLPRSTEQNSPPQFYTALMRQFANAKLWSEVLVFREELQTDGVEPDTNCLILFMNAAINVNEDALALQLFRSLALLEPPSQRTYMTVLRVYTKRKDWEGAISLIEEMESLGSPPDNLVLNQVLGLCAAAGQSDATEKLLNDWDSIIDVVSCNSVLKAYASTGALPAADALLKRMLSLGPAPNIITFNTMMDCSFRCLQCMTSGSNKTTGNMASIRATAGRPWELFDQLIEIGLEPDRYTCSTIVKGMHLSGGSSEEIDRAIALLKRLGPAELRTGTAVAGSSSRLVTSNGRPEGNARLVEVLFNTLLDICSSNQDIDRMVQIFELMQSFGVGVSSITFCTLIKAFGQSGKLNQCHDVWSQMLAAEIVPTVITYGCYIDACVRNKATVAALKVFHSMSDHSIKPNAVVYTSLIRGLASAGQPAQAFAMYRHMRAAGVEPTSVTFNSVLDMVARKLSDPAVLQEVLDDMKIAPSATSNEPWTKPAGRGSKTDTTAYCILINASCKTGQLNNAIMIFRQLRDEGITFDQGTFNVLLLMCAKAGRQAVVEEIFSEMCKLGMTPTNSATTIVLKMFSRGKDLEKCFEVLNAVEQGQGEKPNVHVYTCVIAACIHFSCKPTRTQSAWQNSWGNGLERALEVFERMLQNAWPDAIAYDTTISGCIQRKKLDAAMNLVHHALMLPLRFDSSEVQDDPCATRRIALLSLEEPVRLLPDTLSKLQEECKKEEKHELVKQLSALIKYNYNV